MHLSAIALVTILAWGIPKDAMFGVRVTNLLDVPTFFKLRTKHGNLYRNYLINIDLDYRPGKTEESHRTPTDEQTRKTENTNANFDLFAGVEFMNVKPLKEFSKGVQANFLSGFTPFLDFSSVYSLSKEDSCSMKDYTIDGALGLTGVWGLEATFKAFGKDMALQVLNSVFTVKAGYSYRKHRVDVHRTAGYSISESIRKTPYIDFTGLDLISGELSVWLLVKL